MPRSSEEIFNFLVRNSFYEPPTYNTKDVKKMVENYKKDPYTLQVAVSYVPSFYCPVEKLVEFIGEEYSFSKHIFPLIKQKLISCAGWEHMNVEEAKLWDGHLGLVKNYQKDKSFFRFWLGR